MRVRAQHRIQHRAVKLLAEYVDLVCTMETEAVRGQQPVPELLQLCGGVGLARVPQQVHHLAIRPHSLIAGALLERFESGFHGGFEAVPVRQVANHKACQRFFRIQEDHAILTSGGKSPDESLSMCSGRDDHSALPHEQSFA
jgi:hypothetical protein